MSGYCSLQASAVALEAGGAMHLAKRSGGGGHKIEFREARAPVGPELGLHAPADEGRAHRRRLRLQLDQLLGVVGRQRLGNGRHHLRDLHQRPLQRAERAGQRLRVARRVAAGDPVGRHARGERAGVDAEPRIARGARGKSIGFARPAFKRSRVRPRWCRRIRLYRARPARSPIRTITLPPAGSGD